MAEQRSSFDIPWPAVMALLLAASSAVLYYSPLSSDRPDRGDGDDQSIGYEDVSARLWQDPLQAALAKYREDRREAKPVTVAVPWGGDAISWKAAFGHGISEEAPATQASSPPDAAIERHSLPELWAQIRTQLALKRGRQRMLLLPVMVQGDAFPEIAEQRLRARVAVLEALGFCGYSPSDVVHLGYFSLDWSRPRMESGSNASINKQLGSKPPQSTPTVNFVVPYEWCGPAPVPMAGTNAASCTTRYDSVLVLWLNENLFYDEPLERLGHFLDIVTPAPTSKSDNVDARIDIKIIGPRVSTTLRAMAREANELIPNSKRTQATERAAQARDWLSGVSMYSPTATASEDALLWGISSTPSLAALFAERFPLERGAEPFRFTRTTLTDQDLCQELLRELWRRGVQTPGGARLMGENPSVLPASIAVIGEWDTLFGRALPITFAAEADCKSFAAITTSISPTAAASTSTSANAFPSWIKPFVYLRGIDGKIAATSSGDKSEAPGNGAAATNAQQQRANSSSGSWKTAAPSEQPEGLNQSDYLRRLADQLRQWDAMLHEQGDRLSAVGVLGTDLYDKLLVLRALRDRLPTGILFFTTSLDARYNLPLEWPAAHNLIVTSSYGLRLNRYYQGNIPPFRDSEQTATYAATLEALGYVDNLPERLDRPRVFEIARRGAFDLSVNSSPTRSESSDWDLIPGSLNLPANVHPPRPDLLPWWNAARFACLMISLGFVALIIAIAYRFGVRPKRVEWRKLLAYTIPFLMLSGTFVIILIAVLVWFDRPAGEPFALFEGISVWPAEALRLMAALLCLHFVIESQMETERNDEFICEKFNLSRCKPQYVWAARWRSKPQAIAANVAGDAASVPKVLPIEFRMSPWKVFREKEDSAPLDKAEVEQKKLEGNVKVYAQDLWEEYSRRGALGARLMRALPIAACYFFAAFAMMHMFGMPLTPVRGTGTIRLDFWITVISVLSSILFTFIVIDATYINSAFIRHLAKKDTHWPNRAHKNFDRMHLTPEDLTEFMDIQLIAQRTKVVGKSVYFPFLIYFLMIVCRISLFDNWDWPTGLLVVLAVNFGMAIGAAMMLRQAAERARNEAIAKLNVRRISYLQSDQGKAGAITELITSVQNERAGAFSVLSQYPWLAAVILPSSGIGLWALLEYVAKVFSGAS